MISVKTYKEPPFCKKEILRYLKCKEADCEIKALMEECIKEASDRLSYRVCYREFPVEINGDDCDFGAFCIKSKHLALNLEDCRSVIIFAATVGVEADRLIAKYSNISPAKAVMLHAVGAERAEALCDVFCEDIAREMNVSIKPRFSPGYGDLPLAVQKDIFSVLDCNRKIGLTLNDNMFMSPTKSVTAFIGITNHNLSFR